MTRLDKIVLTVTLCSLITSGILNLYAIYSLEKRVLVLETTLRIYESLA